MHAYMQTLHAIHKCLHDITWHHIALRCITLHETTFRHITSQQTPATEEDLSPIRIQVPNVARSVSLEAIEDHPEPDDRPLDSEPFRMPLPEAAPSTSPPADHEIVAVCPSMIAVGLTDRLNVGCS